MLRPDPAARFELPGGGSLGRDDEVVTFVSRGLEPYRGFHLFMRALPRLQQRCPKAQVVIVGRDKPSYGRAPTDAANWREKLLGELEGRIDLGRVHFTGTLPYASFVRLLQVSRAHVYMTYPFVLSWSMLEAMSAGCVVVGSATGPVQEVIDDGHNGLLVDFFSTAGIADAIDRVLSHPDRMAGLRARARQTVVEHFDLKRFCLPRHVALVDAVASGNLPPNLDAATPIVTAAPSPAG